MTLAVYVCLLRQVKAVHCFVFFARLKLCIWHVHRCIKPGHWLNLVIRECTHTVCADVSALPIFLDCTDLSMNPICCNKLRNTSAREWNASSKQTPESGIELLHVCGVRSCPCMHTYGSIFRPLVWRAVVSIWVQVKRGLICDAGTHFSLYPTQQNTSYWEDAHLKTLHPCTLCFVFSLVRQAKGHDLCVEKFLIPERLLINVGIC